MTVILSIVAGTFNRLDYLRAMITSARRQIPPGLDYEFILIDGGSDDGTLDWAREQADVKLIEHGRLLGAIRAFTDGAHAATGDYVLLANDDVLFHDGAILRALLHLEQTPQCGAVAFMDNRKAPGYEQDGFHVQTITALRDGQPINVIYAQVGLYRRWLGELANWWDMGQAQEHTYGGDAYLSARIWELGYTVEAVEGAAVTDRVAEDDLRQRNTQIEHQIGSAYYRRYPNGVKLGTWADAPQQPASERMRILYLPLYEAGYGHYKRGLREALERVGWVMEYDYANLRDYTPLLLLLRDWQPHLVLMQVHNLGALTTALLEQLRQQSPASVFVNWNGDVYADQLTAPSMLDFLKHVQLQLVVNSEVLPTYAQHGIAAAYWQIGFEPVPETLPSMMSHPLLFLGNAYSPARRELGALLRELDPLAGLYGMAWGMLGDGNTLYDFASGAALYRNCTIAIGDNQYGDQGFVSNRLFEALANGAFLLQQRVPGLEALTGLQSGVHYVEWETYADLRAAVELYSADEEARQTIAAAGEAFVREHHSFAARVRQLFEELLPRIADAKITASPYSPVNAPSGWEEWADGIPR